MNVCLPLWTWVQMQCLACSRNSTWVYMGIHPVFSSKRIFLSVLLQVLLFPVWFKIRELTHPSLNTGIFTSVSALFLLEPFPQFEVAKGYFCFIHSRIPLLVHYHGDAIPAEPYRVYLMSLYFPSRGTLLWVTCFDLYLDPEQKKESTGRAVLYDNTSSINMGLAPYMQADHILSVESFALKQTNSKEPSLC